MYGKVSNHYAKFKQYVKWLYSLYELNTQISICEPWEKVFCNVLLGSCLSLLIYASFAYVPGYCRMLVSLLLPISECTNKTCNASLCAESDGVCSSTESHLT